MVTIPKDIENVIPFSCSTNLSNDVLEQVRLAPLGSKALKVCLYLHRQTFGNAGWHRKKQRREYYCTYDLARWASEIPCDKSNLRRILSDLEAAHIIWREPDTDNPGSGRIGWNLSFAEWLPYDHRTKVAKQQPDMVIYQQGNVVIYPVKSQENTPSSRAKQPRQLGKNPSKQPRPAALAIRKITTSASFESTAGEAPPEGEERVTEERDVEETTANAVAAQNALTPSPSSVDDPIQPLSTKHPQQETFWPSEEKRTSAAPPARPRKPAKPEPTPEEIALEERKAALRKVWLEHPNPRVVKPTYPGSWSAFNKGINLLALAGIEPEQQGPLIDAMLTWSKGAYMPTPMKMYPNLDEVQATLIQLQTAQRGANHNGHQQQRAETNGRGDRGSGIVNKATNTAVQRLLAQRQADQQAKAAE